MIKSILISIIPSMLVPADFCCSINHTVFVSFVVILQRKGVLGHLKVEKKTLLV